ncbi:MAG TPA: NAD(P)H-hydrate epimerase, partial [Pseudonocardiaceae bacterium]
MRGVWTVEQVRAAEGEVMAGVGDGVLMRRAAFGLAVHCVRLLRELGDGDGDCVGAGGAGGRGGGRVVGRHVVLLVGSGDNGGDALFAGAELRRRGVRVTAVLLAPERVHAAGLA